MKKTPESAAAGSGGNSKMLVYFRQHWQLYVIFMLPAFLLTIIFRYIPMGGILIAFTEYNPIRGIFGSEWVGFEHFHRFLSSPDFMRYLANTLKLSVFGLLWGFPAPILLAFLLNRILSAKTKQKIQLVLSARALYAELYLCHRPLRYRAYLACTYRHGKHDARYFLQLHDNAFCIPDDLHRFRYLVP